MENNQIPEKRILVVNISAMTIRNMALFLIKLAIASVPAILTLLILWYILVCTILAIILKAMGF